ncbi:MAG: Transposase [Parcubacteria group bacterium GW2011_GWC1_34_10]|nr:MAG: Transposase [Parcubacteria group bacterium GW2011_GWC1_34_10]
MERKVSFAPGEYFHIYNRGTEKIKIFNNTNDYQRFLESLYLFNSTKRIVLRSISKKKRFNYDREDTLVDIGAYCLMPNHFHLLIRTKDEFSVSNFMKKLLTAYSMYFNKKYNRSGVLFQGPFKAQHVTRDEYLKYPIKLVDKDWKEKGIQDFEQSRKFLNSYKNSSYVDYIGDNRLESSILNKIAFPEYFKFSNDFDQFINFWISFKNNLEKYT